MTLLQPVSRKICIEKDVILLLLPHDGADNVSPLLFIAYLEYCSIVYSLSSIKYSL